MKKSSVIAVAALVLATSLFGAVSANAANKAGGTCAKKGAAATITSLPYTCAINPSKTSTKLTWVANACIKAYESLDSINGIITQYTAIQRNTQRTYDNYQKAAAKYQANIDKWTADVANYLKAHPDAQTNGTAQVKQQLAQIQAGIDKNTTRVKGLNDSLPKLKTQIDDATKLIATYTTQQATAQSLSVKACV